MGIKAGQRSGKVQGGYKLLIALSLLTWIVSMMLFWTLPMHTENAGTHGIGMQVLPFHTHTHAHTHKFAHKHTHKHTRTHARTHARTHTHTHTHTHICMCSNALLRLC
jgi:ABC-type nickel/cobalt efflux system permease component RcnA